MSNFEIFTCPCCDTEFLVDYKARTFEMLDGGDEVYEDQDELDYEDDEADEVDGDFVAGVVITAEGEPGLDKIRAADPNYSTTYKAAYEAGAPVTPGQVAKQKDGKVVIENEPPTGHGSGIRVETAMNDAKPQPRVKQRKQVGQLQPMGELNNVVRPKGKNPSREGFEVTGADASQDFVGLTGQDAHFDNLLQQAYENDLADRGF